MNHQTIQSGPRLSFGKVVFAILVALNCSVLAYALFLAIAWPGKTFPGFLINKRMVVGSLGPVYWTGVKAGLKFPDKVLSIEGTEVKSPDELYRFIHSSGVGTPLHYVIERSGVEHQYAISTMQFGWVDLLIMFGMEYFAGIVFCVLGIVVFVLKPNTGGSWAFFLTCWSTSIFTALTFDVESSHRLIRLYFTANGFCAAAVAHLSLLFPEESWLFRKFRGVVFLPYVGATALLVPLQLDYPGPIFLLSYKAVHASLALSVLGLLLSCIHSFLRTSSVLARARARVVLIGAAFGLPGPAIGPLLSVLGKTVLNTPVQFTALSLLLFPAAIGYAIARHNLFDVDLYIKRTVGYVLMTGAVAGGYFVLQSTFKATILDPLLGHSAEQVYPFLFALLTVFAFNPVSRFVQGNVDKLFYRKVFDYKTTVATLSESLASIMDVGAFIELVIQTIRTDLFVDRVGIVLLDERTNSCQSVFRGTKFGIELNRVVDDPCLIPQDPLLSLLAREKVLITKYDVDEDPRYSSDRESCSRCFEDLGASVAVPLFYHDKFAGALALGYKKSGHFYTGEDIDLLKTLSSMTSTAIEQSREKGQKAVLMQLFSKHVSPQVAESLWEQREQFLEGGRPKAQSMVVTAMFTDLQGFSTLSEKQTPDVLMRWLNTYLEMMTTTVMDHGGVVDDFFGDGVKINFGVPIPRETEEDIRQDAINAVTCSLAMSQKMVALNQTMTEQGQQPLRMRIGIHTGPVVAGSLGSAERMKYTTIGDTVNTAARLESFDKDLILPELQCSACRILIGGTTLAHVADRVSAKHVGDLVLKGKQEKISAYCVLAPENSTPLVPSGQPSEQIVSGLST
jgi:class 3 adenylate cyclase